MINPRLTQTDNGLDLLMENGRVVWATEGIEAAQHGAVRLHKFIGESVIDDPDEDYTKWYEIIFAANKSRAEKELEIKRRILGTTGVIRILTFQWSQTGAVATITGSVLTAWGAEDISATIEAL